MKFKKTAITALTLGLSVSTVLTAATKHENPNITPLKSSEVNVKQNQLSPVIELSDLAQLPTGTSIVDIRGDKEAFLAGHIPGSVQIGYGSFRGPKNNPGKLFKLTELAKTLSAAGLQKDQGLVVVSEGKTATDFGAAARVYWSLKSVGFQNLSILNGGFKGYADAKLPLEKGPTNITPTELTLEFNNAWYSSTDDIKASIDAGTATLLDSRLPEFFAGKAWHDAAKRPGSLPGAKNFAFTAFFDKTRLKPTDEVNQIVSKNSLNQSQTISYCNTGHWAATNWFILSEVAQVPDVSLYAESMVEWSNADLSMDNVPGAFEFALLKSKKWFDGLLN